MIRYVSKLTEEQLSNMISHASYGEFVRIENIREVEEGYRGNMTKHLLVDIVSIEEDDFDENELVDVIKVTDFIIRPEEYDVADSCIADFRKKMVAEFGNGYIHDFMYNTYIRGELYYTK